MSMTAEPSEPVTQQEPPALPAPSEETAPPPPPPPERRWARPFRAAYAWSRDYALAYEPGFFWVLAPLILLSMLLYTRAPTTNYIFDEQEALLANPYVNATGGVKYFYAIYRDFWGLPVERTIGSYRPIPNYLWRALWAISKQPFFHHFYNVIFHAINGALLAMFTFRITRRRGMTYLAGLIFVSAAILTEAVSGIVGIADVFGGMGAILGLLALALPGYAMPFAVFASITFGLFSKESALVCVPLIPFAALIVSPLLHPSRPSRVLRTLGASIGAAAAFVLYVELRRRWFPSADAPELLEPLPEGASHLTRAVRAFLLWFHQAPLPHDPLNNPLAAADKGHRIAGALRVYFRGLSQVVFPRTLSGDYSFPQEPAPDRLVFPESVLGGLCMVVPPLASVVLWIVGLVREARARVEAKRLGVGQEGAPRRVFLILGAIFLLLAPLLVVLEFFVLRPRGIVWTIRGFSWVFAAVPVLALALGFFAESGRALIEPDAKEMPRPLGRAGIALLALGFVWVVVSYFPHSNIPVVLPTVRAERFWYFPVIGTTLVLATAFAALHERLRSKPKLFYVTPALFVAFFTFQGVKAYAHAMDYRSDLTFWEATKNAVPRSAKAHLNFSVMKGARSDMETRLSESLIALELAPDWAMAHVYTGDTLCRMHRPDEAWPHYAKGFDQGPNDIGLIALALQCLWDEKKLFDHEEELRALGDKYPGSWIEWLGNDTLNNGEKHGGVDPKYRPRSYNEGPKDEPK